MDLDYSPHTRNEEPAPLSQLRMTTYQIPSDRDLAALAGEDNILWARQGCGLVGLGTARQWQLRGDRPAAGQLAEIMASLRALRHRSADGQPYPTVLGAVPFLPADGMTLVLPKAMVRRDSPGVLTVSVLHEGEPPPVGQVRQVLESRGAAAAAGHPEEYHIAPAGSSHARWKAQVRDATQVLAGSSIRKIVLARRVRISASGPISRERVLRQLLSSNPSCMVFGFGGFVAASPELVVSRSGQTVKSYPLAGTMEHSGSGGAPQTASYDSALKTDKMLREHKWCAVAVSDELAKYCRDLQVADEPHPVRFGAIVHLGTAIEGTLLNRDPTAAELCRALVPTPAVGGYPRQPALDYIADAEEFDRGLYGGAVGWMDSTGDGEWALGIRCGALTGNEADLYAGVGLVDGSDPEAEFAETQWKLRPMINAIVMP